MASARAGCGISLAISICDTMRLSLSSEVAKLSLLLMPESEQVPGKQVPHCARCALAAAGCIAHITNWYSLLHGSL